MRANIPSGIRNPAENSAPKTAIKNKETNKPKPMNRENVDSMNLNVLLIYKVYHLSENKSSATISPLYYTDYPSHISPWRNMRKRCRSIYIEIYGK